MPEKTIILLPIYNRESIIEIMINKIRNHLDEYTDVLIIDDGSTDDTENAVKTDEKIKYLKHESSLGYGAALIHGIDFAKNFEYDNIITLDMASKDYVQVIAPLLEALQNGAEIANCSRTESTSKSKEEQDFSVYTFNKMVSSKINNVTGYNLSDIFSPFKAFKTRITEKMSLEEYDEAFIIQFWIQAAYFGFQVKEIYCEEIKETEIIDDNCLEKDQQYYVDFVETEKYLYPMKNTN